MPYDIDLGNCLPCHGTGAAFKHDSPSPARFLECFTCGGSGWRPICPGCRNPYADFVRASKLWMCWDCGVADGVIVFPFHPKAQKQ